MGQADCNWPKIEKRKIILKTKNGKIILKHVENKKGWRGIRGHAPPENFWNFTFCYGHFCAFWTSFRLILLKVFAPNSECCTKYDALYSCIFHYACLRRNNEKVRNYGKGVFIKNIFINGWWGDASPTFPLDTPLSASIMKILVFDFLNV